LRLGVYVHVYECVFLCMVCVCVYVCGCGCSVCIDVCMCMWCCVCVCYVHWCVCVCVWVWCMHWCVHVYVVLCVCVCYVHWCVCVCVCDECTFEATRADSSLSGKFWFSYSSSLQEYTQITIPHYLVSYLIFSFKFISNANPLLLKNRILKIRRQLQEDCFPGPFEMAHLALTKIPLQTCPAIPLQKPTHLPLSHPFCSHKT